VTDAQIILVMYIPDGCVERNGDVTGVLWRWSVF